MRNTHASPAGSTSLAPWPSSRKEEAMIRFFEQNLRYPKSYKGTGTKVRIFYSFTIDSLGMLQNPVSLPENILYPRDTGKTYDEFRDEALRVLRLMPPHGNPP